MQRQACNIVCLSIARIVAVAKIVGAINRITLIGRHVGEAICKTHQLVSKLSETVKTKANGLESCSTEQFKLTVTQLCIRGSKFLIFMNYLPEQQEQSEKDKEITMLKKDSNVCERTTKKDEPCNFYAAS